jgi:hypothetical protein
MMNEKARRVRQKTQFVRTYLEEEGCSRCGFYANAAALIGTGTGRTSALKLAHDDYSWQKVKRALDASRVLCLNCQAIETHELKIARLTNV